MTDYRTYKLNRPERLRYYCVCCACLFSAGMLFYRSAIWALPFTALSIPFERIWTSVKASSRRRELSDSFKDALYSIAGSVAAGRQMPRALSDATSQAALSRGAESDMARELRRIVSVYESFNGSVCDMLSDFAQRSGIEEIRHFASSYGVCLASGGDIESVCLKSSELLIARLEYRREIESLAAQKKLDISVLTAMPLLLLAFMNATAYSYLSILYTTAAGRIIMTCCLALIAAALLWSLRIMDLKL